tara:strand:- start:451 stop:1011 length:561 start_codon:yes stop_codon:yes gene_type:complete
MKCKHCNNQIPEARLKALPNTKECVSCSSEERNLVRTIITGKTTYSEWEVVKNKETKEYLERLEGKGRTGFGSMLYRGSRTESQPNSVKLGGNSCRTFVKSYTKENLDKVLKEAMLWIDTDKEYALQTVDKYLANDVISQKQYKQILQILEVFNPTPEKKVIEKKEVIDEEISHAFRNWRNSRIYK